MGNEKDEVEAIPPQGNVVVEGQYGDGLEESVGQSCAEHELSMGSSRGDLPNRPALSYSLERFVETSFDLICTCLGNGKICQLSIYSRQLSHISDEAGHFRTIKELFHPEDAIALGDVFVALQSQAKVRHNLTLRAVPKHGHYFCFDVMVKYDHDIDAFYLVANLSYDTHSHTALANAFPGFSPRACTDEAFQHLSALVKSAHISVLICDKSRRITWVNDGFECLTGYLAEEAIGKLPSQLLQGELTSGDTKRYIAEQLAKKEPVDCDILNYNKKGGRYWIRLSITPILDESEVLSGFIGFQTDISQSKRSEELLTQAKHLESLNMMVGGVAHDFNNVLGIANSNLDAVLQSNQQPYIAGNHIEKARSAIARATDLTQRLLQFSVTSTGGTQVTHIQGAINEVAQLLAKSFASVIGCKIEQCDTPLWSNFNKCDFEDCIINLALNGRDAINGDGRVTIAVSQDEPNRRCTSGYLPSRPLTDSYCQITIQDNGQGIAEQDLDKVFTPFYTTKTLGKGTGLGMSLVYNFVRRSKGFIGIDSIVGVGTKVWIWLPLCEPPSEKSSQISATSDTAIQQRSILLLDDEQDLLDITATLLRSDGHLVSTFNNAKDAMEALKSQSFDLLISDVLMPGECQPADCVQYIRQHSASIRILLMSGYQGADDPDLSNLPILQKPFSREKLRQSVNELFE